MKYFYLILSMLFFSSNLLTGQEQKISEPQRWDSKLSIGESFMGLGSDFISTLNQTFSGSDLKLGNRLATSIEISRIFRNHLKVGINTGITVIQIKNSPIHYDPYKFNVFEISTLVGYEIANSFSIKAGPAFYHISYSPSGVTNLSTFNKGGFIVASDIKFLKTSRFYLQIELLYEKIAQIDKLEVDFYNHKSYFSYDLNTSHFYFGLGIGRRFN
jgi:hypothetical protein